jgi:hypothetical protein
MKNWGKVAGKQLQRTRAENFSPKKLSTGGGASVLSENIFPGKNVEIGAPKNFAPGHRQALGGPVHTYCYWMDFRKQGNSCSS